MAGTVLPVAPTQSNLYGVLPNHFPTDCHRRKFGEIAGGAEHYISHFSPV